MRNQAKVDVGDRITVTLKFDPRPREVPVPNDLARALRSHRTARAAWGLLTPSRRKEVLRYLISVKRQQTLDRNIRKVIALLEKILSSRERLGGIRVRER